MGTKENCITAVRRIVGKKRSPLRGARVSTRAGATPRTLDPPQILILERDPAYRRGLTTHLNSRGFEVHSEADGAAARWCILTSSYDAIVLDLGLLSESELGALQGLAERNALPPIVVLSEPDQGDSSIPATLGAARVVEKPCTLRALVLTIHDALKR